MRYIVGARVPDKYGKIEEGIYAFGKYGFAGMFCKDDFGKDMSSWQIPVFDNLESAQKYVKHLAHAYRYEFHSRVNRLCKIEDFRFYLLRLDTPKMSWLKLIEPKDWMPKKHKDFPGRKDYNFEINSPKES
jgi:hypothetical protein